MSKDPIPTTRLAVGVTMLFAGERAVFAVLKMRWKLERGTGSWVKSSKTHQFNPASGNDLKEVKASPHHCVIVYIRILDFFFLLQKQGLTLSRIEFTMLADFKSMFTEKCVVDFDYVSGQLIQFNST